jgi:hypothetical protein
MCGHSQSFCVYVRFEVSAALYEECRLLGHKTQVRPSQETHYISESFAVFTAVTMKYGVFWYVTSCGSCKNRSFGGT